MCVMGKKQSRRSIFNFLIPCLPSFLPRACFGLLFLTALLPTVDPACIDDREPFVSFDSIDRIATQDLIGHDEANKKV